MIKLTLVRFEASEQGTFGTLEVFGARFFTGELPWKENRTNISCIPEGLYHCTWNYSLAFRKMLYQLVNVPGRTGIRIHSANLMGDKALGYKSQLHGCIALGEKLGTLDGQKALLLSAPAMRVFEKKLRRQPFELEVIGGGTIIRGPN